MLVDIEAGLVYPPEPPPPQIQTSTNLPNAVLVHVPVVKKVFEKSEITFFHPLHPFQPKY